MGNTRLICTASVDTKLPIWLKTPGRGWLSAEYGMLPRSTLTRMRRERGAYTSNRALEISRLIGRSLRACLDFKELGERQILLDCDVIRADGGTRTAAVTGGFVALSLACHSLKQKACIKRFPITQYVAGLSVGILQKEILLDLCYAEDREADCDLNVVYNSQGDLIEIQGTAEKKTFSRSRLNTMLDVTWEGCKKLLKIQESVIGSFFPLESGTGKKAKVSL